MLVKQMYVCDKDMNLHKLLILDIALYWKILLIKIQSIYKKLALIYERNEYFIKYRIMN